MDDEPFRQVGSMSHPLTVQLRFARSELVRCLTGVSAEDAIRRLPPMNSISWIVGHLADQENRYWNLLGQGRPLATGLNALVGHGRPASTPPLSEMRTAWEQVTAAADPYLDTLTSAKLEMYMSWRDRPLDESIGTMLLRVIYHYWYHIGEISAIRQLLGHQDVPEFVGDMASALYSRSLDADE